MADLTTTTTTSGSQLFHTHDGLIDDACRLNTQAMVNLDYLLHSYNPGTSKQLTDYICVRVQMPKNNRYVSFIKHWANISSIESKKFFEDLKKEPIPQDLGNVRCFNKMKEWAILRTGVRLKMATVAPFLHSQINAYKLYSNEAKCVLIGEANERLLEIFSKNKDPFIADRLDQMGILSKANQVYLREARLDLVAAESDLKAWVRNGEAIKNPNGTWTIL